MIVNLPHWTLYGGENLGLQELLKMTNLLFPAGKEYVYVINKIINTVDWKKK